MRKNIKKFLEPAFCDKGALSLIIINNTLKSLTNVAMAVAIKSLIDLSTLGNYPEARKRVRGILAIYLIQIVPNYFFRNAYNRHFWNMRIVGQQEYMERYFTADSNTMESLGTGKIQSIIFTGINAWHRNLSTIFSQGVRIVTSIVLGFAVIALQIGREGLIAILVIVILSSLFVRYGNRALAKYRRERRDIQIEGDRRFVKMIMSKNEILQNSKIEDEQSFIHRHYKNLFKVRLKESRKTILTTDTQSLVFALIRAGVLGYTLIQLQSGNFTIGALGLLWMLMNQVQGSITDLADFMTGFNTDRINIEKVRDLFEKTPQIKGYKEGDICMPNKGDIVLDNITYNYGKGEVLENFSLDISGGKKLALVGASGSGKSTLIKLIAGYIYPQQGSIRIDGQELPNPTNKNYVSLQSYYQHIGYLTQEPSVFDGSIYENLTYALHHEPTEQELQKAIQGAQCQFINDYPEGVQTQIGEKGIKLSGGQRQRLAIAKIMLKNPRIILLDEPTSALDSFSEEEVSKAFNTLFTNRTVVIIAHRLQTVKNADRIVVIDKGAIIEDGTHTSLVAAGGTYAKMLDLQSGF